MRCTLIIPLIAWAVMACQSGHHSQQAPAVSILTQNHANHGCSNGNSGLVHRPFMVAIWRADLDSIARQINAGADLNISVPYDCTDSVPKDETTPLIYAIQAGILSPFRERRDQVVELLIQKGADPNLAIPPPHASPLALAASTGDLPSVKILLKHGAHIDARDSDGETAFLKAAQRGNSLPILEELVRGGADIHAVNDPGDNAVMLAAWQHQLNSVKLLIQLGVDPCAKNNAGETAIDMAKTNLNNDPGKQAIISLLKSRCGN